MTDKRDDFDDFWDLSKLVPKKKPNLSPFSTKSSVSEVTVDAGNDDGKGDSIPSEERKLDFSAYKTASDDNKNGERSYAPASSRLIKRVTIKPSHDRFDFYDTFRKAALIYFDYKCARCEFVPFYSYKPQYAQMTSEQKKYYFYWRDELRRKRYLQTDYSYIYLYAYEILNLPEKIGKEEGLRLLLEVWLAYRADLPRLDINFAAWVQDYCLVYELECPFEDIKDFLFDLINVSVFKEFYLSDVDRGGNASAAMLAYLSDYDWRRGKYAGGDNAQIYRMHVEAAMQRVFALILSDEKIANGETNKITRTAFPGSLCTHTVKCILEIEYSSISSSPELRKNVTSALKYVENKLRAILGVKSRLAIKELPDSFRRVIDKYFESEFEKMKRERERAAMPEYERLYDAPETLVSFEDAVVIERASWKMTARLVEGIEDYEQSTIAEEPYSEKADFSAPNPENIANNVGSSDEESCDTYGLDGAEVKFLLAVSEGDAAGALRIANESKKMPETLVERINEAFADNFGDVILEESDTGGYKVIDDYTEEISEWLQKILK